jgi:hypothetical protein
MSCNLTESSTPLTGCKLPNKNLLTRRVLVEKYNPCKYSYKYYDDDGYPGGIIKIWLTELKEKAGIKK